MKRPHIGDSRVGVLEGIGGRPTIVGDWHTTQDNLLRVVQGTYEPSEPKGTIESSPTFIGKALVAIVEKIMK